MIIGEDSDLFMEFKVKHNKLHSNYANTDYYRDNSMKAENMILKGDVIRRRRGC